MLNGNNDTILRAVNPEGVAYSLHPAGLVPRALAYLIDTSVTTLIMGIVALIIFAGKVENPGSWLFLLTLFAVQWFYHVAWEIFGNGASPGKKLFGIKVVSSDGSPVSPGSSFIRSLLRFADSFLGLTLIGVLTMLFSPGFRRLGDWGANTLVVYRRKPPGQFRLGNTDVKVKARASETPLTGEDKMQIISFARRYNRFGPTRGDEIAAELVPAITENPDFRLKPGEYLLSIGAGLTGGEDQS